MHIASPTSQIKTLTYSHSSAVTSAPRLMLLGARVVYALNNSLANASNAYVLEGLVRGAPKTTGQAWTINVALYWDNTNSLLTTTSTSNTLCGYAAAAAASGDTTGDINLISLNP